VCSTRRRKPGLCNNTVALSIQETDEAILSEIEGEVLGTRHIDELLAVVASAPDPTAHLQAKRDRLCRERDNLASVLMRLRRLIDSQRNTVISNSYCVPGPCARGYRPPGILPRLAFVGGPLTQLLSHAASMVMNTSESSEAHAWWCIFAGM
jgi:hypothetical protein